MSELAGELSDGNQELKAKELALLSDRLASNGSLLTGLRGDAHAPPCAHERRSQSLVG